VPQKKVDALLLAQIRQPVPAEWLFDSKSALIEHYKKKLGATHFKGQRMYIETVNALKLVRKYFQN